MTGSAHRERIQDPLFWTRFNYTIYHNAFVCVVVRSNVVASIHHQTWEFVLVACLLLNTYGNGSLNNESRWFAMLQIRVRKRIAIEQSSFELKSRHRITSESCNLTYNQISNQIKHFRATYDFSESIPYHTARSDDSVPSCRCPQATAGPG